jgi:hypothetical protein
MLTMRRSARPLLLGAVTMLGVLLALPAPVTEAVTWRPRIRLAADATALTAAFEGRTVAVAYLHGTRWRLRISRDGGTTFGPAIRAMGQPPIDGLYPDLAICGGTVWAAWWRHPDVPGPTDPWAVTLGELPSGASRFTKRIIALEDEGPMVRSVRIACGGGRVWMAWQADTRVALRSMKLSGGSLGTGYLIGDRVGLRLQDLTAASAGATVLTTDPALGVSGFSVGPAPARLITAEATRTWAAVDPESLVGDQGGDDVRLAVGWGGDLLVMETQLVPDDLRFVDWLVTGRDDPYRAGEPLGIAWHGDRQVVIADRYDAAAGFAGVSRWLSTDGWVTVRRSDVRHATGQHRLQTGYVRVGRATRLAEAWLQDESGGGHAAWFHRAR